jgi:PadR family transcriptional regulator, regulatory protein AphA
MSLRGAILGFLSLEPTSGYTLKQRFDGSVRSFWSVTQSQIYRELHALEKEALVEATVQPGDGRPDKKVYALTRSGRAALKAWLAEPLPPLELRHPLLLKLVFASEMDPDELAGNLLDYRGGMTERQREYQARLADTRIFSLARSPRERAIWRLSIENGLAWCEMEIAWIDRALKQLGGSKKWKRKAE